MLCRFLLLATCLGFSLPTAVAQSGPGPAYFLRHPATAPHQGGQRLLPASPAVAPLPATGAPVPTVLRYNLTTVMSFPLHVPPGLPEPSRLYTPPVARDEPTLPQPARSALSR